MSLGNFPSWPSLVINELIALHKWLKVGALINWISWDTLRALQKAYRNNIIRNLGCEMIETNTPDIGDQKSPITSQPSSSFSSTLDGDLEDVEKNGTFYYTWAGNCWNMKSKHWQLLDRLNRWKIDPNLRYIDKFRFEKHNSFLPPLPTSIWQIWLSHLLGI